MSGFCKSGHIWDAACESGSLNCEWQPGNPHDPSAIAIMKESTEVGHVLRTISTICSDFYGKEKRLFLE